MSNLAWFAVGAAGWLLVITVVLLIIKGGQEKTLRPKNGQGGRKDDKNR